MNRLLCFNGLKLNTLRRQSAKPTVFRFAQRSFADRKRSKRKVVEAEPEPDFEPEEPKRSSFGGVVSKKKKKKTVEVNLDDLPFHDPNQSFMNRLFRKTAKLSAAGYSHNVMETYTNMTRLTLPVFVLAASAVPITINPNLAIAYIFYKSFRRSKARAVDKQMLKNAGSWKVGTGVEEVKYGIVKERFKTRYSEILIERWPDLAHCKFTSELPAAEYQTWKENVDTLHERGLDLAQKKLIETREEYHKYRENWWWHDVMDTRLQGNIKYGLAWEISERTRYTLVLPYVYYALYRCEIHESLILMFDDLFNNSLIYEYPAQFGAWCVLGAYVAQIFAPVRWNYSVNKHAQEVGLK